MRGFRNILMALLIVAALFGGNCLSCPQVLMAMAAHQPSHSCCHHRTTRIDCPSWQLSHFVNAQGSDVAPVPAVAGTVRAIVAAAPGRLAAAASMPADPSPPDLLSLHSLLRI